MPKDIDMNKNYKLISESLDRVSEKFNLRRMARHAPKKLNIWLKGGKLNPMAQKKIKDMNKVIAALESPQGLSDEMLMLADRFGFPPEKANDPRFRKYITKKLKIDRNEWKAAIRQHQGDSKKLVVGAGVAPPVISTAVGVGASAHYSKKD